MNTRTIKVTVKYDMSINPWLEITPPERVKKIVEDKMIDYFGWDEGYNGLTVEVIDE